MKTLFSILILLNFNILAKVYDIPIYDQSREPLVIIKDGVYSGLYIESFEAILKTAKIEYRFVPLPNDRRRQAFIDGKYLIECCSNESWRTKSEEIRIQRFSDSFLTSKDIFIFSEASLIKNPEKFNLKFALVKGFDYGGYEDIVANKTYLITDVVMLEFLSRNRAQVGIVDESVFAYHKFDHPSLVKGDIFKKSQIKIRVNKNEDELIDRINTAIAKLKSDGFFKKLEEKYLGGVKVRLSQNPLKLSSN